MKSIPGKSNWGSRYGWLAASLLILVGACEQEAPVERAEVARPIKMMSISTGVGSQTLEVPGSVFAAQSAELSFEVSGRMLARIVEEGQMVGAGEVLAKLDPRDYVAQRNGARARRDTAKADYDRYRVAFEKNAVTEQQVSRSKGQLDISQAELDVAKKALQDTELRAPFAGRIARTADFYRPGIGDKLIGVFRRVTLVGAELIKVVVSGDLFERAEGIVFVQREV